MISEKFLKIGKFGRPVFWAFLMVYSVQYMVQFLSKIIFEEGLEFTGLFMSIFIFVFLLIAIILSVYQITHLHISYKYESVDEFWSTGIFTIILIAILYYFLRFFFNLDILTYI